jgi:tetratricopeptide (TPR) repeat protein
MGDPLVEYLRTCCVHVLGESPGCGFFIAPNLIVTCSHVVGREVADGTEIMLEQWKQANGFCSGTAATVWRNFPADDIAFIQTSYPNPAYAPLSVEGARSGHQLIALGFPLHGNNYVFDQISAYYEGQTLGGQPGQLKFKAGQVEEGFSGGPLLNLNTCRVMGVVRLTRDDRINLGGWAVESLVLVSLLRKSGQELPKRDPNWTDSEAMQRKDSSEGLIHLTPEQLRELLQNPGESKKIEQLSLSLGENRNAIRLAIRSLGESESQIPDEMLTQKLTESVKAFERQLSGLAVLGSDDSEIDYKYKQARLALESDNPEKANDYFGEAAELANARARAAEELQTKAREVRESGLKAAAEATAQRGQLAMARLAYLDGAKYFAEAADLLPPTMEAQILAYRQQQASALYRHGDEQGDNKILCQAIETYRYLLQISSKELTPQDWAAAQNNLGIALARLGERESSNVRLEEALTCHRAALGVFHRELFPLDWAWSKNNLGNALQTLGERESSPKKLEEAVTAHQDALEGTNRELVPLDWAAFQNNLGNALARLGQLESSTNRLEEAITAYRAAHEEFQREREPMQWSRTQNNLANALYRLGVLSNDKRYLMQSGAAIEAFSSAPFNGVTQEGELVFGPWDGE